MANHAPLLADLVAGGSAIPDFDHLIIDEAHNLEDAATNQFGGSVSMRKTVDVLDGIYRRPGRDHREGGVVTLVRALPEAAFGPVAKSLEEAVARCTEKARPFFDALVVLLPPTGEDDRVLITGGIRHSDVWGRVESAWHDFEIGLRDVEARVSTARKLISEAAIESAEVLAGEVDSALRKVSDLHLQAAELLGATADDLILWAGRDRDTTGTLNVAPLEVGPRLWEELLSKRRVVVATSATLSANNDMSFASKRLGFEDPQVLQLGSPFDYPNATLLCAVEDVPDPSERGYLEGVARAVVELTLASDGRALALFTSNAALRRVADLVRPELEAAGIIALAQGVEGSPKQLTDQLRNNPRTLVLGTSSFWEGVDIPGDDLSVLVIVRLPFAVPTDPIFAARSEASTFIRSSTCRCCSSTSSAPVVPGPAMSTTALKSGVVCEGNPKMMTARSSVERIRAPTIVPPRLKRPPASEVPPSTTTMIASISFIRPMLLASAAIVMSSKLMIEMSSGIR